MTFRTSYIWIFFAVVLLLILQYRLWFDDSGFFATRALEQQVESLRQENDKQSEINRGLLNEVLGLREGDALLEEHAREELGLIKEGETFILFADPDKNKDSGDSE